MGCLYFRQRCLMRRAFSFQHLGIGRLHLCQLNAQGGEVPRIFTLGSCKLILVPLNFYTKEFCRRRVPGILFRPHTIPFSRFLGTSIAQHLLV